MSNIVRTDSSGQNLTPTSGDTNANADVGQASLVAAYPTHDAAEDAVRALHKAGLDLSRISIIGRGQHTEEHPVGFYTTQDRMKFWGGTGAMWGGLYGLLLGSALFFLPATGPLMVMGPLAGILGGVLEGAAVGGSFGVLAGALASVGIPKDSVLKYEVQVKEGQYLVVVHGTHDIVTHAQVCLEDTKPLALSEYGTETRALPS